MKIENPKVYTFTAPPEWLAGRSDYSPWSEGQAKIWQRVEGFYSESAPSVFDRPDFPPLTEDDVLALKLLTCWLYHWEAAGTEKDGEQVAAVLAAGHGFVRGGNLGGNPLFDLVHAEALCWQQNRAAEKFNAAYSEYLKAAAARIDRRNRFEDGLPEWWVPFYMYLTGLASDNAKPALDSFCGYSGLKNWLRVALGLFLRRHLFKERGREVTFSALESERGGSGDGDENGGFSGQVEAAQPETPEPEEWQQLVGRLSAALRKARLAVSDEEWTRLYYHFGLKLQNQQIARLLGEDGSTTTRRRKAALTRFRAALLDAVSADPELRDLWNDILTTWGREYGNLMDQFFKTKHGETP